MNKILSIRNQNYLYYKYMATLVDIEKFMYNWYKSKVQLEKSQFDNKEYIIDILKLKILSSIFQFELNKVELKKSKIHGYGVFATKNISKDELITFYPGDIVLIFMN